MQTKRLEAFLQRLKARWFPSEDDKTWRKWVDFRMRETRDLVDLLKQDVRENLKARAVFLLLVPDPEWNPLYWVRKCDLGKFYQNTDFLKTLSPGLLKYATDLICEFCGILRPLHCERPKHVTEGVPGFQVFMSIPGKYHAALYFYNQCILMLLTLLPDDEASRVFEFFSIKDISTFANMDDASGYNPLEHLMFRKDIDEKWKRKADALMREIVLAEHQGKTKPREEHESAVGWYANILDLVSYHQELPYSRDLFISQLEFLISDKLAGSRRSVSPWKVVSILSLLEGDKYRELRHQFSRFVLFANSDKFTVWSKETEDCARLMLAEFGDTDPEIKIYLKAALEEGNQRVQENMRQAKAAKDNEESLLASMR